MGKEKKSKQQTNISNFRRENEFNTFSKLIYPHLESLGYPPRQSRFFDEQTWVHKRGKRKGPYDGAFKNDSGIILLVEAKSEKRILSKSDENQLFDYCLGESFPIPPPYALLSNGKDFQWYKRLKDRSGEFSYTPCDEILWSKALEQKGSGLLTEQLTLKQVIRLLKIVREKIFDDLTNSYFSEGYIFSTSKLETRKIKFEKVLETRKSFVDPTLEKATEETAIRSVISSIALSLTLKVLFIKIITDRQDNPFPKAIKKEFKKYAESFPGILEAEPYDVLDFSSHCEEFLVEVMSSVSITQALVFEDRDNPIGDIWDGLVRSEELDLQVKSLGNVYTPPVIVNSMVDRAEKALGGWKSKKVLEPACGSGHFVREIYKRMCNVYLGKVGNKEKIIQAHLKTISHIKAIDIDPFAVQTTQLGMFLELYKTPALWKAIAPNGYFDFSIVVKQGDFIENKFFINFSKFAPDLVIGNPPYGIKVNKKIADQFDVGSNDSYGCFISKSLNILPNEGKLLFILSSTFLTNRTHKNLRKQIFNNSLIESIYTLHRNVFSNRDVFCCIFDITKRSKEKEINDHLYHFYDAWPIHPSKPEFLTALKAWSKNKDHVLLKESLGNYSFPQHLMNLRLMPPKPKEVENKLSDINLGIDIDLTSHEDHIFPIVAGLPSLYLFCVDKEYKDYIRKKNINFPKIGNIKGLEIKRNQKWIPMIKLWQVAQVKQGLATADDKYFLRKTPGVIPNARRKYIKDVDLRCIIDQSEISSLTLDEKENGIKVLDRKREKYFVPFDKGGEQNTEKGELRLFWSPVDYWIDWSKKSVTILKERNTWPAGTPKKPRFQNKRYYFISGIRFSRAGLYAPTFELSFGGVFGDKGSLIIPSTGAITKYLLGLLCSPLIRYLTKNFLQHTVMTEIDIIRQIPIVVPTEEQFKDIIKSVDTILLEKNKGNYAKSEMNECWEKIYDLFAIPKEDQIEIETWFKRRYPHFGRAIQQDKP